MKDKYKIILYQNLTCERSKIFVNIALNVHAAKVNNRFTHAFGLLVYIDQFNPLSTPLLLCSQYLVLWGVPVVLSNPICLSNSLYF